MIRNTIPSRAVTSAALVGAPAVTLAVQAAQELGVHMGPATVALASSLITSLFAYFTRGGRKGEAH